MRADTQAGPKAYLGQGFRVVGTAERHAKIDGRHIDEIIIERRLTLDETIDSRLSPIDHRPANPS